MIFSTLQLYEESHRNEANENAITHAIGWSGLFNGFSGDKGKSISPEDILPYPDMMKGSNTPKVFTAKTFNMIMRLMRENRVPPPVMAFLHQLPEIQQKLIADGTK